MAESRRQGGGKQGRPLKKEADLIEPHLLDAARQIFIAQGYAAATMDAIVSQARASKRTVYSRFPSKAALFEAAINDHIDRAFTAMDTMLEAAVREDSVDIRARLLLIARAFLSAANRPASLALDQIVLSQAKTFPKLAARINHRGFGRTISIVKRVLETSQAVDPTIAAQALYALLVLTPMRIGAAESELGHNIEKIVDFVLAGAGIKTRP